MPQVGTTEGAMGRWADFARRWLRAAAESGRSVPAIVWEALMLRRAPGSLGISEYFDFRLYLDDLGSEAKRAFGGWRAQGALEEILVDDYSRFLSLDKLTMYATLAGYGLPIPRVRAVYLSRRPGGGPCLDSADALAEYLRQPGSLPVYLKPSLGAYGRGNLLLQRLQDDRLTLGDGNEVLLTTFCSNLDNPHGLGWVLQEPLLPHPSIAAVCSEKISGIRVHSFMTPEGPTITKAIFKLNVGREDSDNFRHGASGNLLAAVDVVSGRVIRVIAGTGFGQAVNPLHPVSGRDLAGFTVPCWADVLGLVCSAHQAFPGFICPGWDIAICPDGPKILEVNSFGDIDLSQHAYRQGFLDEPFMALMQGRGLAALLTGRRRARSRSPKNQRFGIRSHHWDW